MQKKPEILTINKVAESRIFKIEAVDLTFSNGEKRVYERFQTQGCARGAVMIVPINDKNELLLVREYAVGMERYELNFPKGMIDEGDTPEQAALRELQEEASVSAKRLDFLKTLAISPGYMCNKMQVFVARDLFDSELEGDEPEPMEVVKWPLEDYQALLKRDDFTGGLSISALTLAREFI